MFQEDGTSSVTTSPLQTTPFSPRPWLKPEDRGLYLIHLLMSCANHVASNDLEKANTSLDQISHLSSPEGDTMQRLASYFSESLADKIIRNWPGVYRAFHSTRVSIVAEEILVKKMFFEFLPFMKVAFLITNRAIVEAMEGEKIVHVIDLNAGEPFQWRALIQDLCARPEGPPHLRITGIHQEKEVLDHVGHVLIEEAEKLDLGFQFNPVVSKLENLDFDKLGVKTGEAVAISSILQLHTLLAFDEFNYFKQMNSLKELLYSFVRVCPKIMVVVEQDCDDNGKELMGRVEESLYFYASLFDCLECTLPRVSIERLRIEKMLLGEEIKNVIACEGVERKERHERLEKWCQRFDLAGFSNVPLSYYALLQAKRVLQTYKCDGYKIKAEKGGIVLCWHDRPLFSASAWRFRR